jgi:MFS family permease
LQAKSSWRLIGDNDDIISVPRHSGEAMNLFETRLRKKFLFASLYLSEGAPIGFIWLALPTRLRAQDIPIEQITWLAAILVLPWTFKFVWAPLVDLLRGQRWTLKNWVISAQIVMGLTLVPLLWVDPKEQFSFLAVLLLLHAVAAATQDVAIDALCISTTDPGERGQYNGWMQTGMMLGRAMMGGGALVLSRYFGDPIVVVMLIMLTTFSMFLLMLSRPPAPYETDAERRTRLRRIGQSFSTAVFDRNTWLGLAFALTGGAAFKSLEVIYGPFLIDCGLSKDAIGWFSLGPMIGAMIVGAIVGGRLADGMGARRCAAAALIYMSVVISVMAVVNDRYPEAAVKFLLVCLAMTAFGIGIFTAASYALLMDISRPAIAATQFSAFMGATNGCESWSSYVSGKIIGSQGYPAAMLAMSAASLIALPLLWSIRPPTRLVVDETKYDATSDH